MLRKDHPNVRISSTDWGGGGVLRGKSFGPVKVIPIFEVWHGFKKLAWKRKSNSSDIGDSDEALQNA